MDRAASSEATSWTDRPFPQMAGRLEDARLLQGRGRYIDDLPVGRRTLHAAILRSPHAHARLGKIDLSGARAVHDVVAAYCGQDIAAVLDPFPSIVRSAPPYRAVAIGKVRYVGEPVAVVLARDRYAAEDGLAAIDVVYEPLPAVIHPGAACGHDAPLLHEELKSNVVWRQHYRYGDPERAFAQADRVVRVALTFPKYNSTPLETYGVVAEYLPETDGFVLHGNFQGPFSLMPVMARAMRVPESRLRVIVPQDIGGSFGIKAMIYPYMALMAACARLSGRPVKWIEDRMEHLLASASGTDRESELEAAVSSDGRIDAIRMVIRENVGAYLRAPEPSCVMRSLTTFSGPYRIESGEIDASCVLTNKLPTGLNRGYGGQQYIYSLERLVDRVASELGLDRIEVRRRNFLKRHEFPYRTTTGSCYDSGDYDGCLDQALDIIARENWAADQERLRRDGRLAGIGIATAVHSAASNIGYVTLALPPDDRRRANYNPKSGSNDFADVALDPSGRIRVQIGTAGAGQGHVTTVAQIAAREFGVRIADVDVVDSIDTQSTPWTITSGTYASRFSVVVTAAVQRAAAKLGSHLRAAASHLLAVDVHDLELADGLVRVMGASNRSISLRQIAGALQWNRGDFPIGTDIQLHVSESYSAPNLASPDTENRVNAAVTYGFMADLVLVEIDPKTCIPRVLRYAAVHDVGRPINPQLIRGQVAGGIVQGMGGALYEHCDYDDAGQMLAASFMDYLCPTAVEAPRMAINHHGMPSPVTALGSKGVGENCAMSAPAAIASAVEDALRAYEAEISELPITPALIWRQLNRAAP
jgi:2-furoyl-CoA dehydrogenase large subunit